MAKRIIKFTPIAASVALTLGLTGCGSDNDNNKYTPDPVTVYKGEVSTDFNTQISGKAVKGSLKNAVVSVSTLNDAGESVPVAFRLEATTDATYSAESTTSQADADAKALAMLTAENPADAMTSASGGYSIYLEDDFTGPLYITVSTSKEGDDSMVKCDSFTGCGDYDSAPEMSDVAGMVNNGDSSIDFGEWYKDDLELQVVKFIKAPTTAAASNLRGPSFADGDGTGVKHYFANVTLYTSIAAKMLLDAAKDGSAVSDEAIAAASLKTLIQILGPEAAIKAAALLADVSLGGAVDFSDIGDGDSLDAGTLALVQTAVSLQSVAGSGANGSLKDLIASLSAAVQDGKVSNSDNEVVQKIAAELQKAVENTSLIFAAVVSGEGIEEAFAKVADNLGITDPDAIAKLKENATKAVEEVKAKAKEAGLDDDLAKTAKEVKDALEKIGCEDNCDAGDDFIAKAAAELELQIIDATTELAASADLVTAGTTELATVKALGDTGLETAEQVLAYSGAVFSLSAQQAMFSQLQLELTGKLALARGVAATAVTLGEQYQQLADKANVLSSDIATQLAAVTALIAGINEEVTRSDEAVAALGIELDVAKNNAQLASTSLDATSDAVMTAQAGLATAMIAVEAAMLDNQANAQLALTSAQTAVVAATNTLEKASALTVAVEQAKMAAATLMEIATDAVDKQLATSLAEDAQLSATTAITVSEQATIALASATSLESDAMAAIATFTVLVDVKASTDDIRNVSLVTKSGGEALFDTAEVIYDVLSEAWDLGDEGTDVVSTRYPDWTYSFDKDALELDLVNTETGDMITVNGSINNKAIIFAFGGMVETAEGAKIHIETLEDMGGALENCIDANAGTITKEASDSCLVINFEEEVSSDTVIDGTVLSVDGWSRVEIVDADSGFVGTLSLSGTDMSELAMISATGITGEIDFTAMLSVDWANEDDIYAVDVELHNGTGYKLSLMAEEGEDFMGSVDANFAGAMMKFGTVTEITNGISVEYIDGEVIEYTDITFLDSSK
ncbi:hypothetical protein RC083_19285 [Pseudoalteromonas haloplanktis]|uniref:Uncharacterized protein n=1 Tax=Pseudoalteromonas haloplanktis TaxID=228 RepID=A0ABU1BJN0_PSEHA|nr:hypothetical protein [Pseudoalteromonas haloplanktis]MDQ9093719.1 hypothetical protein [Pseudoalteromonas haloplanktis]